MVASLTAWLKGIIPYFLVTLYNYIIDFMQACIDGTAAAAAAVLTIWPAGSALPSPMTQPTGDGWLKVLQCISWIFPLTYFASLVALVVTGLTAYFTIAPVARWFKLST